MKKIAILFYFLCPFFLFSFPHQTIHSDFADYSLMPVCELSKIILEDLNTGFFMEKKFPVNICYQDYTKIPKELNNGYSPEKILQNLSMMVGEVRYFDIPKQKYVPIFRDCEYDSKSGALYIKDKNFGRMYCSSKSWCFKKSDCAILATLNRPLANPLFWEIKKNEFNIFVFTNECDDFLELYILIQSSFKMNKLLRARIENAFAARINGMQDWFVRMYCGELN